MFSSQINGIGVVIGVGFKPDIQAVCAGTSYVCRAAPDAVVQDKFVGVRIRANQVREKSDWLLRWVAGSAVQNS